MIKFLIGFGFFLFILIASLVILTVAVMVSLLIMEGVDWLEDKIVK